MHTYGQFCPVAQAAEIVAERWTPLILRELLAGSHRFNELEAGVPRISRSLLVSRLRSLERCGLIERRAEGGRAPGYYLTPAGLELRPIIEQLGVWGQRWVMRDVRPEHLDPSLLMWDIHRRINRDLLPPHRIVVQVDFRGDRSETWWLLCDRREVSVCLESPGDDIHLLVTADTLALHRVWIGRLPLAIALRDGLIQLDGPTDLVRAFPGWLALGMYAHIPLAEPVPVRPLAHAGRTGRTGRATV